MSKTTYSHGEFCWEELGTRNVSAAKDFYAAVAGLQHRDDPMPWGEDEKYTTFFTEGGQVGGAYSMASMKEMEGVPAHWLCYIYTDDVDATAAKAVELGGSLQAEPMDVPGVCRMAVVLDPQGAMFGLFTPSGHPGMARHGFAPGGFSWFDLMTTDVEGAKAFYGGLFGWGSATNDMGGTDYTSWRRGEQGFGGMMQMHGPEWEGIPSHWMPYMTVAEIDAALAAVTEHGGKPTMPAVEVPDVGRFAIVADPDGAHIALIAYSEAMLAGAQGEGKPAAAAAG